ncbi:hypothetical protein BKA80DRAFT_110481 [Phyllosticta citrichinensis]
MLGSGATWVGVREKSFRRRPFGGSFARLYNGEDDTSTAEQQLVKLSWMKHIELSGATGESGRGTRRSEEATIPYPSAIHLHYSLHAPFKPVLESRPVLLYAQFSSQSSVSNFPIHVQIYSLICYSESSFMNTILLNKSSVSLVSIVLHVCFFLPLLPRAPSSKHPQPSISASLN